jgi:hypothetical protein
VWGSNPTLSDSHTPIVTILIAYFSERMLAAEPDAAEDGPDDERGLMLDWHAHMRRTGVDTPTSGAIGATPAVSGTSTRGTRCHLRRALGCIERNQ